MTEQTINLDVKPWYSIELEALLVLEGGAPVFRPKNRPRWFSALSRLLGKAEAIPVRLVVERRRKRSEAQNAFWWVGIRTALQALAEQAKEAGVRMPFRDEDDLHEWAKIKWLGFEDVTMPDGSVEKRLRRSSELTVAQFSELSTAFASDMANRGIYLPPPEH